MRAFLDTLRKTGEGVVLAVSHENPMLAVLAVAGVLPAQAARGRIPNCAWVRLAAVRGGWGVQAYSDGVWPGA